ncbi:MAG TPA: SDR family oxidoreductase [Solirubrobacteraceae bacterium]|nr:SDR family oxidoreductase [Solirubrobacteraceae bacterium]
MSVIDTTLTITPRQRDERPVLLTGATGFVGMELLVRVLEQTDRDVVALVRAQDDAAAERRIDDLMKLLFAPADRHAVRGRVRGVAADLEQPGLGLSESTRDELTESIGAVVHCAASVSFTLELEEARRINVEGTREILRLAAEARDYGALDRVVHVSTAYVAGERGGRARERQGDVGQSFRNTYEQTKLEAEQLVHDSGLPAAILRPSVIVGDSVTGWTPCFNVIYWPLQAFARGLFDPIPGDAHAPIDIVPVDVVADALLELLTGPVRCGPFHVVASDEAVSNQRLATMAADFFDTAPPKFVGPGVDPSAEVRAGVFMSYFKVRCTFDALRGRRTLGAKPPPIEEYFPALMRYARAARWGKAPANRWAVGAGALENVA